MKKNHHKKEKKNNNNNNKINQINQINKTNNQHLDNKDKTYQKLVYYQCYNKINFNNTLINKEILLID